MQPPSKALVPPLEALANVLFVRFVGLECRDLPLDLFGRLGELLGLGSMPDIIIEIFIHALSYSSRLARPFIFTIAAACAYTRGSGLSEFMPS